MNSFLRGSIRKQQESLRQLIGERLSYWFVRLFPFVLGLTLGEATVRLLPLLNANFVEPLWGQTPLEKLTERETFPEQRERPEEAPSNRNRG